MILTPWFRGQDGTGLSEKEARDLFGAPIPTIRLKGDKPPRQQPGGAMYDALLGVFEQLNAARKVSGYREGGTFYGVRGVGISYPHPTRQGERHIIPIALFNPSTVKLLTEPESRALVAEPLPTRRATALEVIDQELGGLDSTQLRDVESSRWATWGVPAAVVTVLGVAATGAALTR